MRGGLRGEGLGFSLGIMETSETSNPAASPDSRLDRESVLDRPAARLVALGVMVVSLGLLAWIHRDDLFPPEAATLAADNPLAICLAERTPAIEQMLADGVIDGDKAALFKSRAEALCLAQFGRGSGPPVRQ